jgi:DNA-binding NarL/FixJ family response regulator
MNLLVATPIGMSGDSLLEAVRAVAADGSVRRVTDFRSLLRPELLRRVWAMVVVDLELPGLSSLSLLRSIVQRFADSPVVAIGSQQDEAFMQGVLDLGCQGYMPKSYGRELAIGVLRIVQEGSVFRPRRRAATVNNALPATPELPDSFAEYALTPREIEVLSQVALGRKNNDIGMRLGMKPSTVRVHVSAILQKLGVRNRGEAQLIAQRLERVNATQLRDAEKGSFDLDLLLPHMRHRHCPAGTVLFNAGDSGHEMFYIQRGAVSLPEIDVHLGPGEFFGEISIFAPHHTRTCSAICVEASELFSLDEERVRQLQFTNPQFATLVLHLLARRLSADLERSSTATQATDIPA